MAKGASVVLLLLGLAGNVNSDRIIPDMVGHMFDAGSPNLAGQELEGPAVASKFNKLRAVAEEESSITNTGKDDSPALSASVFLEGGQTHRARASSRDGISSTHSGLPRRGSRPCDPTRPPEPLTATPAANEDIGTPLVNFWLEQLTTPGLGQPQPFRKEESSDADMVRIPVEQASAFLRLRSGLDYEVGGVLDFDTRGRLVQVGMLYGEGDSVQPDSSLARVLFHTHPEHFEDGGYDNGLFSPPSAADVVETLSAQKNGYRNSNVVFAREGAYVYRANTRLLEYLEGVTTHSLQELLHYIFEQFRYSLGAWSVSRCGPWSEPKISLKTFLDSTEKMGIDIQLYEPGSSVLLPFVTSCRPQMCIGGRSVAFSLDEFENDSRADKRKLERLPASVLRRDVAAMRLQNQFRRYAQALQAGRSAARGEAVSGSAGDGTVILPQLGLQGGTVTVRIPPLKSAPLFNLATLELPVGGMLAFNLDIPGAKAERLTLSQAMWTFADASAAVLPLSRVYPIQWRARHYPPVLTETELQSAAVDRLEFLTQNGIIQRPQVNLVFSEGQCIVVQPNKKLPQILYLRQPQTMIMAQLKLGFDCFSFSPEDEIRFDVYVQRGGHVLPQIHRVDGGEGFTNLHAAALLDVSYGRSVDCETGH